LEVTSRAEANVLAVPMLASVRELARTLAPFGGSASGGGAPEVSKSVSGKHSLIYANTESHPA